jgi:hypothetical protein
MGFNDYALLPDRPAVRKIVLRAGSRVDRLSLTLDNGYRMAHGGTGGTEYSLTLNGNEYLTSATFCAAKYNNHTRVFYADFTTSQNRSISGGTQTDDCETYGFDNLKLTLFEGKR